MQQLRLDPLSLKLLEKVVEIFSNINEIGLYKYYFPVCIYIFSFRKIKILFYTLIFTFK